MRFESNVAQLRHDIWKLRLEIFWLKVSMNVRLTLNSFEQFIYS